MKNNLLLEDKTGIAILLICEKYWTKKSGVVKKPFVKWNLFYDEMKATRIRIDLLRNYRMLICYNTGKMGKYGHDLSSPVDFPQKQVNSSSCLTQVRFQVTVS